MTVCELMLERGDRSAHGSVDGHEARLTVPRAGGEEEIVVPTPFLPDALARLNDLGPRPRPDPAVRLRFAAGELAAVLAERSAPRAAALFGAQSERLAAERLVAELREHWRIEARWEPSGGSPGVRVVEVLDTDGGLWLVVPDGDAVELWPTTPTTVWRLLAGLLPRDDELSGRPPSMSP